MSREVLQLSPGDFRQGGIAPRGLTGTLTDVLLVVLTLFLTFYVLPNVYVRIVFHTGGGADYRLYPHIFANCCANLLVILGSWSASGRLDEKLSRSLNVTLAAHGFLALVIVLTHSFHSNRVMVPAVAISVLAGLTTVLLRHRLTRTRIAVVGPPDGLADQLPPHAERVTDPAADMRHYDVILVGSEEMPAEWTRAISRAMLAGRRVRHTAEFVEETRGLVSIDHFDLDLLPEGGLGSYRSGKRLFDLVLAAVALPFAIPIVAVAGLAILVSMGGPVFFIQKRTGLGGRPFNMIKLRTMTTAKPGAEARTTEHQDDRVTPLGHWLRRTRIDELPQIWHVLIGEMSFIGPRPEWTVLAERYADQLPVYAYRHLVRPGLTGWAQVRSGYAADLRETRTKLAYDLFYLKHFSFALDLRVLMLTVGTLITAWGSR